MRQIKTFRPELKQERYENTASFCNKVSCNDVNFHNLPSAEHSRVNRLIQALFRTDRVGLNCDSRWADGNFYNLNANMHLLISISVVGERCMSELTRALLSGLEAQPIAEP